MLPPTAPAAVLLQGSCSGSHTPRLECALCTCLPENMLREPESRGLPSPQAAGEQHGGQDGETVALTVSQELAPSPLLQESIKEGLGAMREGGCGARPHPPGREDLGSQSPGAARGLPPSESDGG